MKHAKHVLPGNFLAMILIACFKVISIITIIIITINIFNTILMQAMESAFDVCTEDLFNQTVKLEEMEKKAGNAEGEVSSLR